jgi:hypothetical protein
LIQKIYDNKIHNIGLITVNIVLILITIIIATTSAFAEPLKIKALANVSHKEVFSKNLDQNNISRNSFALQTTKNFNNVFSNISLNYNNSQNLRFENSFIKYKNKDTTFGIGKISRNWSFSPNTSLILSSNARPTNSIFFIIESKQKLKKNSYSGIGPWSLEFFNSRTSNSTKTKDSMLLGIRALIEPIRNLKFELLKSSQWGGENQNETLSAFTASIIGNTNEHKYANINQMAGFGISYLTTIKEIPFRVYTQSVGEDEAGNLPSCFINLIGGELDFTNNHLFSKVGFEYIDTRVDFTSHGNCGPNTAYNNSKYDYSNHNTTLGTSIDSEGKSFHIWSSIKLSDQTSTTFSIKNLTINDNNWHNHRLSSTKQNGWLTAIETVWSLGSININTDLSYQGINLDKTNFKNGLNIAITTNYIF